MQAFVIQGSSLVARWTLSTDLPCASTRPERVGTDSLASLWSCLPSLQPSEGICSMARSFWLVPLAVLVFTSVPASAQEPSDTFRLGEIVPYAL